MVQQINTGDCLILFIWFWIAEQKWSQKLRISCWTPQTPRINNQTTAILDSVNQYLWQINVRNNDLII